MKASCWVVHFYPGAWPTLQPAFTHTLQMVDIATGWSERVAILGRGQLAMEEGFRRILQRLPFPILRLHPDNGSEFLNDHLIRFWGEQIVGLRLSRSRVNCKNDNRIGLSSRRTTPW